MAETFRALPGYGNMTFLLTLLVWAVLLVLCWPLALLLLVVWPVLWLLSIPFRILGVVVEGVLALIKALVLLPARLLSFGRS